MGRANVDFELALQGEHTGSSLLWAALGSARRAFVDLQGCSFPETASAFKGAYRDTMVELEVARLASQARAAIARQLARQTLESFEMRSPARHEPLGAFMQARAEPLATAVSVGEGGPTLKVALPYQNHSFDGALDLVDAWHAQRWLTPQVATAIRWIVEGMADSSGTMDLRGMRFAILGAGAELAPTRLLLEGGADVLWIDLRPPDDELLSGRLAGTLTYAPGGADLLREPHRIAQTIVHFAEPGPVHLGMYAYAPGGGRELRLTGAMNAIARTLPPSVVSSISLLISPTTPCAIAEPQLPLRLRPMWQRMLGHSGILPPGQLSRRGTVVTRSIVPVQGASYQAAQYLGKLIAAEAYATGGLSMTEARPAELTVSANVAPITKTRSLAHPLFQAAFVGAEHFGVEMWEPETTRALSAFLMLHDLRNLEAPGSPKRPYSSDAARAAGLLSQQVHGGLFALPCRLDSAIGVAAALGLARRPRLVLGLALDSLTVALRSARRTRCRRRGAPCHQATRAPSERDTRCRAQ